MLSISFLTPALVLSIWSMPSTTWRPEIAVHGAMLGWGLGFQYKL
jgi:hypothetical protein